MRAPELELCARGMRGRDNMWCDPLAWSKRASHTRSIMAKPRPFDFEKVLRLHRPPVAERRCDISGCDCVGEYRAPKSPRQLTDYFWFCLDHVRAYNASWDYYAGMSTDEIEA